MKIVSNLKSKKPKYCGKMQVFSFLWVLNMFLFFCVSLVDNAVGSAGAIALAELVSQSKTLEELW